ncbi:MAG TPA: YjbQ family protein [Gemmataceae bacterium]|nr:YjbQ family protein [Gemmataceae bacterium]
MDERGQPVNCRAGPASAGREAVAITKGKLDFGPWEHIFYGEFDGHRPKRVLIKIIGE